MPTRTKSGRFAKRRYRKNPPKMTPALRAKIGRRVRAAMRARRHGGSRRTRTRTKVRTVVRHSSPVVRYRTRTRSVIRYRSRGRSVARRHARRTGRRGSRGVSIPISVGSVFSKDTLTIAGGAIGSGLLTSIVLNRFGGMLPMSNSPIGGIFYRLAIPVGGAYVVNKFLKQRKLAEGMIIGGVVLALNQVINLYLPQVGAAVAAPAPTIAPTGEYLGALPPMNASYDATSTFGAPPSSISSEPAFPDSAWS